MRKILLIILVLGLLCIPFLPKQKHDKRTEVVFWTLQMNDFSDYINEIIGQFETSYPTIKIKWIDVPFSEGEKRTLASILSDSPPDLVNLNPDFSAILAQKGALAEIDEDKTYQFNSQIINSLKYKGKLYALPWYATSAITIYNKDLYDKAGLWLMPKTYEDLAQIAPLVKEKTGAYVFMPTITENDTMLKILNKYGVNSPETVKNEQSQEVFNFYKDLYQKNLIPKESITQTHREALEKYMSDQIVFFQAGANFLNMIKENSPQTYKHTDVAPQIVGKLGQNDFSLMNFVIPTRAKHKEEALIFALYLTNEENQLALAKLTGVLTTNKNALKDGYFSTYTDGDLMSKARYISAKQLDKIEPVLIQNRGQKEINLLINTAVQEVLLNKSNTDSILNNVAKKWRALLNE